VTPLTKSLVVNGTLVALALASLALVVITESEPTSAELESRRQHLFERFEEEMVDELSIEREGKLQIVRGDGDARFLITAPVQAVAEEATVDRILRELRFATWLRRIPTEDVDRKRMGLDAPSMSLGLTLGETHVALSLGGNAQSPEGARYVEVTDRRGTQVYVISGAAAEALSLELADFRIQRLLPVGESQLAAIELSSARGQLRLERRGRWRSVGPSGATRLDPTAMDRLFLQFARTETRDFIDLEAAQRAQEKAELVTLKLFGTKPEETSELTLGGKCPFDDGATVAWRKTPEPLAACIQSDLETAFLERTELLFDRKLFAMRTDEAEEVRIESGERKLDFARKGEGYVMRAPMSGDIDKRAGDARLTSLLQATGTLLPREPNTPFEVIARAAITRSGQREGDRVTETVELGKGDRDALVARRLDDGALLELDEGARALFGVDTLMLKSALILDVAAEDMSAVDVRWRDAGGEHAQHVRQPQRGVFELDRPEGFEVDSGLATDLIDGLHQLEINQWVSESFDPHFGLDAPTLVCTLTIDGLTMPRVLELGASAPGGGVYGSLDRAGVFIVPRGLRELLTTWVVDRSPFLLETERVERLELSTEERRVTLTRVGTGFVQSSPGPVVNPTRVVELLDAFSLLRTEGMVSPGPADPSQGLRAPLLRVDATLRGDLAGAPEHRRFTIGSADTLGEVSVFYAWPNDGSAVYALPRESVRRIMNLW
jgi:hypothetical protein